MQKLSTIQNLLQFSLIYKPGLLSPKYGLVILDPTTIRKISDEPKRLLQWNEFIDLDYQAQKLFESSGFRLGILAESIFENWLLEQKLDYRRGVQIFEIEPTNRTLGELDFLYKLNDEWKHFELASKIYCFRPKHNDFIGPNKRDFFHRKLFSLQNQQLPLISNPSTIQILKNEGLEQIKESQVHFCGRLFYPPGRWSIPEYINTEHQKGIYYEKILPFKNYKNNHAMMLLPRYLWFLPEISLSQLMPVKFTKGNFAQLQWADLSKPDDINELKHVLKHFQNHNQTTMLILFEKTSRNWHEIQRILLLPHEIN